MIVVPNQTVFKCEHCGRRLLTRSGAKKHEQEYCRVVRQANCKHENIDTKYSYIPGEAVMEPDYDYCLDCGKVMVP